LSLASPGASQARPKNIVKSILLLFIVLSVTGTLGAAQAGAAGRVIDDSDTILLPGSVHPLARPEFDTGPAPLSLPMERMIIILRRSAEKQAELDRRLAALQDPLSPGFHQWLTPDEFGNCFGPSSKDIDAVTGWLKSHGFVIETIGKGKSWINFSGTAADVKGAFHTSIHMYRVGGRLYHANAENPSIPRGLADVVAGVASLNDFPRKPMHNSIRPADQPDYNYDGSHYLSPGDFAIIYDVNALYSAGIDGSGQSIAIVGRTHPPGTEWASFRNIMGLPVNPPQVIVNGPDPGDLGGDEDVEADLDVEWSGAVAKNASILFVASMSTYATDGVDLSAQYIVDNNLAPVMSTSFGSCESDLGTSENSFYSSLWQQAAAQGISSFVSSGDSGASGCDSPSDSTGSGRAVNGLASTPYNVAVGGTEFNEGSGGYWNTGNGNWYVSVLSYIPEVVWNESGANGGSDLWSTGGGVSTVYSRPAWQAAPGVPSGNMRDVPDVSLSAAGHDAYLVETLGALYAVGGTSASSPSFAGLMALVVQQTGKRQGNANARFYQIANAQYGAGGNAVFHGITSGNNTVPGVTGYSAGTGYSCATGLGSVDASALVTNWAQTYMVTSSVSGGSGAVSPASAQIPSGAPAVFTIFPGTGYYLATLTDNGTDVTSSVDGNSYTIEDLAGPHAVVAAFAEYSYTITVVESGDGSITPSSESIYYGNSVTFTITPAGGYTLSGITDNGAAVSATRGPSGTFTYTITDVVANHTVDVTFAPITATPVPAMGPWGLIGAALGMLWLAMRRIRKQ
jgi:subtilase family serine protease